MNIRINGFTFEGPYFDTLFLREWPGVYVVLDFNSINDFIVLDVGESDNIKRRIETHDRCTCWHRHLKRKLAYAVLYDPLIYDPNWDRSAIEKKLRELTNPPCGKR